MTELDIERERREFEADFKEQMGEEIGNYRAAYDSCRIQDRWTGWLAAKRAVLGSAEPVATVVNNWRDDDGNLAKARVVTLGDFDLEHIPHGTKLYTAPPAPVSAEPGNLKEKSAAYDKIDRLLRNDLGDEAYAEYSAALDLIYTSASPSTDAKDSFVSCYEIGPIKIQRVKQITGSDLWAVRDAFSQVLSISGEWVYEPQPSERDDDFIKNHRFTSAQLAFDAAIAAKEARTK